MSALNQGPLGEQLSVDTTAVPLTASFHISEEAFIQVVAGGPIRWYADGRTPTASAGFITELNGTIKLDNRFAVKQFKAIKKSGGSAATLEVSYGPVKMVVPSSSSGGGGGDASAANQVTQTGILTTIDADTGNIATVQGATTDAAVDTNTTGTISGKLRGLVKILASVWDSVNSRLNVFVQNSSIAVTGTFWQATQPVSLASVPSHAVTNAGTFAVQATLQAGTNGIGKLTANSGVDIGDVDVTSLPGSAHDAAVSGNPVRIAARANANEPTAVSADDDTVDLWADRHGRQVVLTGHANPEPPVTVNATASGNTTVIVAPGASVSLYVCKASVHNRASSNRVVALSDGAAGTTRWKAELAAEGGGSMIDFGARGWKLTANTLLNVNLDAAGDVDVNITEYYIAP